MEETNHDWLSNSSHRGASKKHFTDKRARRRISMFYHSVYVINRFGQHGNQK